MLFRSPDYEREQLLKRQRRDDDWDQIHNDWLNVQRKEKEQAHETAVSSQLSIASPDSVSEKHADETAKKVVSGETVDLGGMTGSGGADVNPSGSDVPEVPGDFSAKLSSSKGAGSPLDAGINAEMSQKMNTDFSGVNLHTGSQANDMADAINAKAFTHGQDIYFGSNETPQNKELLAHELVHAGTAQEGVNAKLYRKPGDKWKTADQATYYELTDNALNPVFSVAPGIEVEELDYQYTDITKGYLYVTFTLEGKPHTGFIPSAQLTGNTNATTTTNNTNTNNTTTDNKTNTDNNKNGEQENVPQINENLNLNTAEVNTGTDVVTANVTPQKNEFGFSGPVRDDISWNLRMNATQKEAVKWDEVVAAFKTTNPRIPQGELDQWIRRNLHEGWTLNVDAPPPIKQTFVAGFDSKGVPIIEAYSYEHAFAFANQVKRDTNDPQVKKQFESFRWQTRIAKTLKYVSGTGYASATAYKNYTTNLNLEPIDFENIANVTNTRYLLMELNKKKAYSDKLLSDVFVQMVLAVQQKLYPNDIDKWTGVFDKDTRAKSKGLLASFTDVATTLNKSFTGYKADEQFRMAQYNGFTGTSDAFATQYKNSFLDYIKQFRPDLIVLNNGQILDDYGKSVHEGYQGNLYAFYLTFDGKYSQFAALNKAYANRTVVDGNALNKQIGTAQTNGQSVIPVIRNIIFDTALRKLDDNIRQLDGWIIYIKGMQASNLVTSAKASTYTSYRADVKDNGRNNFLELWLNEPNPYKRAVYENYITGTWNGGCQYCHSMVLADEFTRRNPANTETPIQQLRTAADVQAMRMAPITLMKADTITQLRNGIVKLPPAQGPNSQQLSKKQIDDIIAYVNALPDKSTATTTSPKTTSNSTTSTTSNSGSSHRTFGSPYPTIAEADELTKQLNSILNFLGPQGYNVIPPQVFSTLRDMKGDKLRNAIIENIQSRQAQFRSLQQKIRAAKADPENSVLKFWHLEPVMNEVVPLISSPAAKKEYDHYMSIQNIKESINRIVDIGLTIIGIIMMFVPIPGAQLIGAVMIARGMSQGMEMMELGSTVSLGMHAPNVMNQDLAKSGGQMFMMGAFTFALSAIGAIKLGKTLMRPSMSTAPASDLPMKVRTFQQGKFTATSWNETEMVVTNSDYPGCYMTVTRLTPNGPAIIKGFQFNPATGLFEEVSVTTSAAAGTGTGSTGTGMVPYQKNLPATTTPNTKNLPATVANGNNALGPVNNTTKTPVNSNLPVLNTPAFNHKPTSGAFVSANEPPGTFLIGSFPNDLDMILTELKYPKLDKVDFNFPAPKGQTFNLLNISDGEYDYWVNNGGFFTKVNGPWIDAAVAQKVKIIVVSDMQYAYKVTKVGGKDVMELTGFGKEVHRLEWQHGYRYDPTTHTMVPGRAKDLPAITKESDYLHK